MKEYTTLGALEKDKYDALMKLIDHADEILAKLNEKEEEPETPAEAPKKTTRSTKK